MGAVTFPDQHWEGGASRTALTSGDMPTSPGACKYFLSMSVPTWGEGKLPQCCGAGSDRRGAGVGHKEGGRGGSVGGLCFCVGPAAGAAGGLPGTAISGPVASGQAGFRWEQDSAWTLREQVGGPGLNHWGEEEGPEEMVE